MYNKDMSLNDVLKEFGLIDDPKQKNLLTSLYEPVKKDKGVNMPRFSYPEAGAIAQADLLFMPHDGGYKYMLVVVDNGTRLLDAEAIKSKDSNAVVNAFKAIFKRSNVKMPKRIEVDAGLEFRAGTAKYFKDNNVRMRVAPTGRHRMQAIVESANHKLGSILHKRMAAQELLTGSTSKHWVKDLPKLVKAINTYVSKREAKRIAKDPNRIKEKNGEPQCNGDSCNLLGIDDKVRVALEHPIDVAGEKRLHGKFRASDIRWAPKIRTIKEVLMKPNSPPLYLLDGPIGDRNITPIAYTKNQLQLVTKDEKLPDRKVVRGKPKQYIVEALLGKKKINGKIHYLVHWLGFDKPEDNTYEPRTTLLQEVPQLVHDFEQALKP
jgi:hypothetical protein